MDKDDILKLLDAERRSMCRDGEVIEILPHVTRLRPDDGAYHCVIFSELSPTTVDSVIAEQVDHYHRLGTGFEWKVYDHDCPPDLAMRLEGRGFVVGGGEAVLVLDLQAAAPWIDGAAPCDVVRIERVEQLNLFREAAEEIFGKDYGPTAGQLLRAIERGSTQHLAYIAVVDGIAASIGRLYTHPNSHFGGLYGGGTRPAFRGQGLYRAVVAARARYARELGARFLIVDAMPTSRPILERLGFRHIANTWPCTWSP